MTGFRRSRIKIRGVLPILRRGEVTERAVVRTVGGEDGIVVRPMLYLALSHPHRAVDGVPANGFLFRIRERLEEARFDL